MAFQRTCKALPAVLGLVLAIAGLPSLAQSGAVPDGAQPAALGRLAAACGSSERGGNCFAAMTSAKPAGVADNQSGPTGLPASGSPVPEVSGLKLLGVGLFVAAWIANRRISRS